MSNFWMLQIYILTLFMRYADLLRIAYWGAFLVSMREFRLHKGRLCIAPRFIPY